MVALTARFAALVEAALAAYDRVIGLDLDEVALDASQHKAPCGGETGPNCTDKGRQGWKWSLAADRHGIPVGWVAAPANRHDAKLAAATLDEIAGRGFTRRGRHSSAATPTVPPPECPRPTPVGPPSVRSVTSRHRGR
jgi:hypothetical protein